MISLCKLTEIISKLHFNIEIKRQQKILFFKKVYFYTKCSEKWISRLRRFGPTIDDL